MPYLFKIKNETTFSIKITETIEVRTQCHYAVAAIPDMSSTDRTSFLPILL